MITTQKILIRTNRTDWTVATLTVRPNPKPNATPNATSQTEKQGYEKQG